jgi:hypothetical protein
VPPAAIAALMGGDARGAMEYLDGAAGDAQVDLGADQRVRHRASHSTKSAGVFRRAKKAHTAATWAMQCSADLWQAARSGTAITIQISNATSPTSSPGAGAA